ncbi:hypothetical protein HG263_16555 [Pseudoalteromonas sp. JBTF-M23]|uniref:Uncharacterized protein n=1 Tax=Pseudoalteromonas caenipelagi TaxID=2726988 RepID=A0A849VFF8_9GAMM|nr:hypothetical protein [Pseudoalteromonas caenipelagi]NOU52142.1 hypothetical protein [Pseudoalteromonas caenipelagi]
MTLPQKVNQYQFYKTHTGLLIRQAAMVDPDKCGRKDLYILDKSHPHYSEIVALVLAAHIAEQPLALYLDGCVQGLPAISHIYSNK